MKVLLSIKISIKDYFPKEKCIPYENFICLFNLNNFNAKLKFSNLKNQNFIKHNVESYESNIVYNLHVFESIKNSLIGIYQIIINFDKIKNFNINDTLTQEETAKLIIDSQTKRKLFDKITNVTDISLVLSTEVKVLDKKYFTSGNKLNLNLIKKDGNNDNNEYVSEFNNLTPKTFKKKKIMKTLENDREALRKIEDNFFSNNQSITDYNIEDNDDIRSSVKKYKSLSKAKKLIQNNNFNEIRLTNNNQDFNNSYTVVVSPKHINTCCNYQKKYKVKTCRKKKFIPMKKVTILDLMQKKLDPSFFRQKEENTHELKTKLKDSKYTSNNISIKQMSKINSNSLNNYNCLSNEKRKQNKCKKINLKHYDETYSRKKTNYGLTNKILVNLSGKNKNERTISECKSKNKVKKNNKKLGFLDNGKLNTETSMKELMRAQKINNIFLSTDIAIKKPMGRKTDVTKHIINDTDLKQISKKKGILIKDNFNNNYYDERSRGTFSPKLPLKIKFREGLVLPNEKNDNKTNRYKERTYKKLLTPKGEQIKILSFSNEENLISENEELKKKCFNLIDFYSLLTKKLKKTRNNNIECLKKLKLIKERNNNLNKYKYKIDEMKNNNESKKVKNHVFSHFEEEKLLNKIIDIKSKENSIYKNIFLNFSDELNLQYKINILKSQKKEMLLNLIRNNIRFYGNISRIYDKDKNKKQIFLNLLDKYDIREKINIDLNYINYNNKEKSFDDKIIREVDEDKENEEEDGDKSIKYNNPLTNNSTIQNNLNIINISNIENKNTKNNNIFNDNFEEDEEEIIPNNNIFVSNNLNNKIQEIKIEKSNNNKSLDNEYDENLNNLIKTILIEQFPEKYKMGIKFVHIEKNKYNFKNMIFHAYIEDNDVILKEEINGIVDNNKFTLNEFYKKYLVREKNGNKNNFVYTKKIKQKYIKLKNIEKDQSLEPKIKNENSTTIDTDKKCNSYNSKTNKINDEKL